jgi:hypothetical protein
MSTPTNISPASAKVGNNQGPGAAIRIRSAQRIASKSKAIHNGGTRTSITLDDDVHELAIIYAHARGITLGAALGELVRKGQRAPGRVLTSEMVKRAQEDDFA